MARAPAHSPVNPIPHRTAGNAQDHDRESPADIGRDHAEMADSNHLAGALVVTWAVIAFGEVARPMRLLNIPMGIWIAVAPWVLSGATDASRWADLTIGVLLMALSIRRGRVEEQFGTWNKYLI